MFEQACAHCEMLNSQVVTHRLDPAIPFSECVPYHAGSPEVHMPTSIAAMHVTVASDWHIGQQEVETALRHFVPRYYTPELSPDVAALHIQIPM